MTKSVKNPLYENPVFLGDKPIVFVHQVAEILSCHYSTVYRMAELGVIPKPINIGARKKLAWFQDDINQYVLSLLNQGGAA
jgi:predicted DNA-binding transcriptional regulator AlpA